MALKLKLAKADFETLPEDVKKQYKQNGDEYSLDLEGYEDPGELRRARDREKADAKKEKDRADALQAEKDADEERKSRNKGDIAALEKSWKDKRDADVAAEHAKISKKDAQLRKVLVENNARAIAARISVSPELILPHILSRIDVDLDGDEPKARVLVDGKPSALTLADLEKEFVDNKAFAPIIRASNASGGGASGGTGGGATKAFKDMNTAERTELYRKDPAAFKRETDALKAAT